MSEHLPLILIEVVLVFGGVLAFGWWQLRDVRKAREQTRRRREAEAHAQAQARTQPGDAAAPGEDLPR